MSDNPLQNYIVTKVKQYPNGSFKDSHKKNIALQDIHFLTAKGYFVRYELANGVPDMGSFSSPPHGSWLYVCDTSYKPALYADYLKSKNAKGNVITQRLMKVDYHIAKLTDAALDIDHLRKAYTKKFGKTSELVAYINHATFAVVTKCLMTCLSESAKKELPIQHLQQVWQRSPV